mmetsp:Transcript_43914/g.138623  ORF Transcript_43914/g.138623 Transcript_43914/m.138623 type:complete len:220 (+) Transcript_43914:850-1509(+)
MSHVTDWLSVPQLSTSCSPFQASRRPPWQRWLSWFRWFHVVSRLQLLHLLFPSLTKDVLPLGRHLRQLRQLDRLDVLGQPQLRTLAPPRPALIPLPRVPARHIHHLVLGERYHVRQLLPPALGVEQRAVPAVLAGITVDPSLLILREDFRPDMIRPVHHVPGLKPHGDAAQGEGVGPLSTSSSLGFHQLARMVVAREASGLVAVVAVVQLDDPSAMGLL